MMNLDKLKLTTRAMLQRSKSYVLSKSLAIKIDACRIIYIPIHKVA